MDEAEEEALFARLRTQLRTIPAPSAAPHSETEVMRSLARVEASLRTLAGGLDSLARRVDALEGGLDPRIERAVARASAALRLDVDRLEARLSTASPATTEQRALARARPFVLIGLVAVALIAFAMAAARLGYLPRAEPLRPVTASRSGEAGSRMATSRPGAPFQGPGAQSSSAGPRAPSYGAQAQHPGAPSGAHVGQSSHAEENPALARKTALIAVQPELVPTTRQPGPTSGPDQVDLPMIGPEPRNATASTPPARPQSPPKADPGRGAANAASGSQSGLAHAATPPAPAQPKLALQATAPCWVVVRNQDGKTLVRRLMKPGEVWDAPDEADLRLTTWNPGALTLLVNGKPEALPRGSALRDMPLNELESAAR
jgi:hypothetical protein